MERGDGHALAKVEQVRLLALRARVERQVFAVEVARKALQHIKYDPRVSRESLRAFENAQNELLKLTIKGAKPIKITDIVLTSCTEAAQKAHPEYFADLPPVR